MTTEANIYKTLKPMLSAFGTAVRIENTIVSGCPDVLFFTHDLLLLLELKVIHSGKIRIQPFQFSFLTRLSHDYGDDKTWFAMYGLQGLGLYPWAEVREFALNASNLGSIDVSQLTPHYKANTNGIRLWIGDRNGRLR